MGDGVMERPDIFQCGHPRGTLLVTLVFYVGFQASLLYPVWHYCKEFEYNTYQDNNNVQDMQSMEDAIEGQWMRQGPLDYVHGRMKGEYGATSETLKLMSVGINQRLMDDIPYLPAGRLV